MGETNDTQSSDTQLTFLLMMCETEFSKRVVQMMVELGIDGFTFIHGAAGAGRSGRREDTDVWPSGNSVIFVAVPDDATADSIVDGAREIIRTAYRKNPGFAVFKMHGSQIA